MSDYVRRALSMSFPLATFGRRAANQSQKKGYGAACLGDETSRDVNIAHEALN